MMSIDMDEISSKMVAAFKGVLSDKWPDVKDYAEGEARKLAENFVTIQKLYLSKKINEEQAKLMLDIQRNSARAVMLTVEGLGLILVEEAVKAGLEVVAQAVNTAIGFNLISI